MEFKERERLHTGGEGVFSTGEGMNKNMKSY